MATTLYTYLGGNPIAYNFDYFSGDRWQIDREDYLKVTVTDLGTD